MLEKNALELFGVIAITIFLGILGFLALGRRMGLRLIARHGKAGLPSAGSLEGAVFALLGLLIAFSFSGALSRFDERRALVVDEANAIGTAYLRIDLLPASPQPRLREAFRQYVDARIATYRKLPDMEAARRELARSQALQGEIWAQATTALRLPDSRPGTEMPVVSALNEMFDISTVRTAATQMHPPAVIFVMLIGFAFASALLAGYQSARQRAHDVMHRLGFAAIVALTVYLIIDLEFPRLGWIRADTMDHLLVEVRLSMK